MLQAVSKEIQAAETELDKDRAAKVVRVRWRKLRTQIFTMLTLDKQNANDTKRVARCLVDTYHIITTTNARIQNRR